MNEGYIKLDGNDKPQTMFYDHQQKANIKTLTDTPKTVKLIVAVYSLMIR